MLAGLTRSFAGDLSLVPTVGSSDFFLDLLLRFGFGSLGLLVCLPLDPIDLSLGSAVGAVGPPRCGFFRSLFPLLCLMASREGGRRRGKRSDQAHHDPESMTHLNLPVCLDGAQRLR